MITLYMVRLYMVSVMKGGAPCRSSAIISRCCCLSKCHDYTLHGYTLHGFLLLPSPAKHVHFENCMRRRCSSSNCCFALFSCPSVQASATCLCCRHSRSFSRASGQCCSPHPSSSSSPSSVTSPAGVGFARSGQTDLRWTCSIGADRQVWSFCCCQIRVRCRRTDRQICAFCCCQIRVR
jgi:hypothetical protein